MGLDAALSIASSGLWNIASGFGVISQNIANANTPSYAALLPEQESADAGSILCGVRTDPTLLAGDPALAVALGDATAGSTYWQTANASLAQLQPAWGTVAQGNDLGSLLGNVQNAFSQLLGNPADQGLQSAVVSAAQGLTQGINAQAQSIGASRQAAETDLATAVGQANTALQQIGVLNKQIVALQAQGQSTADLRNQRNAAVAQLTGLVQLRTVTQANGNLLVYAAGGAALPTDGSATLQMASTNVGPSSYYPGGGIGGITLDGTDITASLTGGRIAADVALRDKTLPTYQAELDEFSETLTTRFDAQGLTLFSNPDGTLPVPTAPGTQAGYVGYADAITVNPAVLANPALVRDGTHAVAGSPTGATTFTPNPQNLPGFTDMIERVLNFSLGADVQQGVTQPASLTANLGPADNLNAPFTAPATLADAATAITSAAAADAGQANSAATDTQATQSALQTKLTGEVGVNMDAELSTMVALQNAYGANAKIVATVQTLFSDVLNMVQ